MVVQKAIDNLKDGPKADKVAVAGGFAVSVVVVLMVAWGIIFFHNIQKGTQEVNLGGGAQDQFNFTSVKEAQKQLQQTYSNTADDFLQIRNDSAGSEMQGQQQIDAGQPQGAAPDQFGTQNTTY